MVSTSTSSQQISGFDRTKFLEILTRATEQAKKRDEAAWQVIRRLLDGDNPETLPEDSFLFVGVEAYQIICKAIGYVPLFVKASTLLGQRQAVLTKLRGHTPFDTISTSRCEVFQEREVDERYPEHDRTTCNDENLNNRSTDTLKARCGRCEALSNLRARLCTL